MEQHRPFPAFHIHIWALKLSFHLIVIGKLCPYKLLSHHSPSLKVTLSLCSHTLEQERLLSAYNYSIPYS